MKMTNRILWTAGAAVLLAATVSCDRARDRRPEKSDAAPDVTTAEPGLTSAEMENLVRRSYQYVALYDTIAGWALNEKSPFYTGGWNKHFPQQP